VTLTRSLRYFLREAAADLWRRRTVNVLSVGTIGASLYVVGLFILVTTNVGRLISSWAEENRISVYMADGAPESQRLAIEQKLSGHPSVKSAAFVTKDDALVRFRKDFPDLADLAVGFDANPLPASFEVMLKKEAADPQAVEAIAKEFSALAGVEGVRYDLAWVRRVRRLLELLGLAGAALGAILLTAAVITISGVIRLNVMARRDEIEILRLVGATRGFIRGPFLVEGAFQGIVAAVVALLMIAGTWSLVSSSGPVRADLLLQAVVGGFLPLWTWGALLAVGLAVGLAGSLLSLRSAFVSISGGAAAPVRS
jgi:cell division transport system permease protein